MTARGLVPAVILTAGSIASLVTIAGFLSGVGR